MEVFQMAPASGKTLVVLGGIVLLLVFLVGLFVYIGYSSHHVRFELSPTGLTIKGGLYARTIPSASLRVRGARLLDLREAAEYRPRRRTFGSGLPGYKAGWFRLRNGERALVFLTDPAQAVYVPTRDDDALLLSVVDRRAFLASLKRLP